MMDFMERSAIKLLKKREKSITEIAEAVGRDRKTVRNALIQPAGVKYQRPNVKSHQRESIVDPFGTRFVNGFKRVFQ